MTTTEAEIKLAIIDDHLLFRKGLVKIISSLPHNYTIMLESGNAEDFMAGLEQTGIPDIILLDINLPGASGFDVVQWLNKNHPTIPILILSMHEDEATIIRMLRLGVKGYLMKNINPSELDMALQAIRHNGYYYNENTTGKLIDALSHDEKDKTQELLNTLTEKEKNFISYACSELTYKEIADRMNLSIKTVDGYRNSVFEKLNLKSRVGLAIFAIKNHLYNI